MQQFLRSVKLLQIFLFVLPVRIALAGDGVSEIQAQLSKEEETHEVFRGWCTKARSDLEGKLRKLQNRLKDVAGVSKRYAKSSKSLQQVVLRQSGQAEAQGKSIQLMRSQSNLWQTTQIGDALKVQSQMLSSLLAAVAAAFDWEGQKFEQHQAIRKQLISLAVSAKSTSASLRQQSPDIKQPDVSDTPQEPVNADHIADPPLGPPVQPILGITQLPALEMLQSGEGSSMMSGFSGLQSLITSESNAKLQSQVMSHQDGRAEQSEQTYSDLRKPIQGSSVRHSNLRARTSSSSPGPQGFQISKNVRVSSSFTPPPFPSPFSATAAAASPATFSSSSSSPSSSSSSPVALHANAVPAGADQQTLSGMPSAPKPLEVIRPAPIGSGEDAASNMIGSSFAAITSLPGGEARFPAPQGDPEQTLLDILGHSPPTSDAVHDSAADEEGGTYTKSTANQQLDGRRAKAALSRAYNAPEDPEQTLMASIAGVDGETKPKALALSQLSIGTEEVGTMETENTYHPADVRADGAGVGDGAVDESAASLIENFATMSALPQSDSPGAIGSTGFKDSTNLLMADSGTSAQQPLGDGLAALAGVANGPPSLLQVSSAVDVPSMGDDSSSMASRLAAASSLKRALGDDDRVAHLAELIVQQQPKQSMEMLASLQKQLRNQKLDWACTHGAEAVHALSMHRIAEEGVALIGMEQSVLNSMREETKESEAESAKLRAEFVGLLEETLGQTYRSNANELDSPSMELLRTSSPSVNVLQASLVAGAKEASRFAATLMDSGVPMLNLLEHIEQVQQSKQNEMQRANRVLNKLGEAADASLKDASSEEGCIQAACASKVLMAVGRAARLLQDFGE